MKSLLNDLTIILYGIFSLLILLYTFSQLYLFIVYFLKNKKRKGLAINHFPLVTVQLPLFNEKYVTERLMDAVAALDYPKENLQIQILDDSTDDSLFISQKKTQELKNRGFDIELIHRKERLGYKAGALRKGLETAKGEFIAIFDADFLPKPDWIKLTLPYFQEDEQIGVVQTRWEHINRDYSIFTQVQALALDHHFTVEQSGRNLHGHFINFNGTAGIWRKKCIMDAGNWEGDTLTEDLDLSYRAQLKNWRFIYLESLGTPSELPVTMSAIKSQQFRWNKGGAENLLKHFKIIISTKNLGLFSKWAALFHLSNSSVFLWAFLLSLLSVPLMCISNFESWQLYFFIPAFLLKYSFIFIFIIFGTVFTKLYPKKSLINFFWQFLMFFPIVFGMTFHNARAVLEAYLGKKSAFIRTPKFNILNNNDTWKNNMYNYKNLNFWLIIELILAVFFGWAAIASITLGKFNYLPYYAVLSIGYGIIFFKSVNE